MSTKFQVEPIRAVLTKCPEAMVEIALGDFPIHQIREPFGGNKSRALGVTNNGVNAFAQVMRRNRYLPYYYVPPVIVQLPENDERCFNDDGVDQYRYELVSGHHRYHAHKSLDKSTYYAQVVEFRDARGKSANYWRNIYQTQENLPENDDYVRNSLTEEDVTIAMNNINGIDTTAEITESSVAAIADDLGIKSKAKIVEYTNKINKKRGQLRYVVQTLTKPALKAYRKLHQTITNSLEEHVLHQSFTVGTVSVYDYDNRGIRKVWDIIMPNPRALGKVQLVGNTTKANHNQVIEIRKKKNMLFKNDAIQTIERAAFLLGVPQAVLWAMKKGKNYEKYCNIPIVWMPQLYGEDEKVKKNNALIRVR